VVAQVDRGDEIVAAALRTMPDVAVIDIDLPGLDGLSAADDLHRDVPSAKALILTGLTQPGNLLRALKARVRGFLAKVGPGDRLGDVVSRVAAGQRVIDAELVAEAVETGPSPLNEREAEVLRAAEAGLPTEEIAEKLHLSHTTVRNYISNAIAKVGARNRLDAIRIARNAGWL